MLSKRAATTRMLDYRHQSLLLPCLAGTAPAAFPDVVLQVEVPQGLPSHSMGEPFSLALHPSSGR